MPEPFVDPGGLLAHWTDTDLGPYVSAGGSCLKWITGRRGSGKTALLAALRRRAEGLGFRVAQVTSDEVPIGRFDLLYRAVVRQLDPDSVARKAAEKAARDLGAAWSPDHGTSLLDALVQAGRPVDAVRSDLQASLDILHAPEIMPPVAIALRQMARSHLMGPHPTELAEISRRWILGEKVSAPERRRCGIRVALDRFAARDVFRSLLTAIRLVGDPGVLLTVDGLEVLLSASGSFKYTRLRRDDAYEGIREFIDGLGTYPGLFLVYAGRSEVFADPRSGLPSYPALAMRVVNEVRSRRPNLLNDVQDLDDLWRSGWPALRADLCRAYGADRVPDLFESPRVWLQGSVSPVKLLVDSLTGERGAESGGV